MAKNPQYKVLSIDAPFAVVGTHTRNATLSSVVTLTAPSGANTLWISVETQNVRARFDGTDPDATTGLLLYAGQTYIMAMSAGQAVKVIEATSGAVVNYQWGIR